MPCLLPQSQLHFQLLGVYLRAHLTTDGFKAREALSSCVRLEVSSVTLLYVEYEVTLV